MTWWPDSQVERWHHGRQVGIGQGPMPIRGPGWQNDPWICKLPPDSVPWGGKGGLCPPNLTWLQFFHPDFSSSLCWFTTSPVMSLIWWRSMWVCLLSTLDLKWTYDYRLLAVALCHRGQIFVTPPFFLREKNIMVMSPHDQALSG